MGYDTYFDGCFKLDNPLLPEQIVYLKKFIETRRVKRNPEVLKTISDPLREKVNLPTGKEGEYFVNGKGFMGQDNDESVIDGNEPPFTQPSLWCQWEISDDGLELKWNEVEKFYKYKGWIVYLIKHFFLPWGYVLNGEVNYQGEDPDDQGTIIVKNNNVYVQLHNYDNNFEIVGKKDLIVLHKVETNKLN